MCISPKKSSGVFKMIKRKSLTAVATTVVLSLGVAFASNASLVGQGFESSDQIGTSHINRASGSANGMDWTAQSRIIGASDQGTGTFNVDETGDPMYLPTFPEYSGVVGMLMQFDQGGFVCSGTLLNDRRSIATAAHCVSSGAGSDNPNSTTIFFQPPEGIDPATSIYSSPEGVVEIEVSDYFVNENYTGQVIDQNDIAILRLAEEAPEWAISHDIYTDSDLTGQDFNVAGYGLRGNGNDGDQAGTGRLREGDNTYDFAFGDEAFDGFFTEIIDGENFFGTAEIDFSYVSDFDNGLAGNDASGIVGAAVGAGDAFNDLGLGLDEVGIAGGDSGGPNFINGLLSGINSYGLSFGPNFGDSTGGLDNSFGEFSGYVPTWIHADFIARSMFQMQVPVPAPAALGLLGLGLGFIVWKKRKQA
jgi:hypothetical protein